MSQETQYQVSNNTTEQETIQSLADLIRGFMRASDEKFEKLSGEVAKLSNEMIVQANETENQIEDIKRTSSASRQSPNVDIGTANFGDVLSPDNSRRRQTTLFHALERELRMRVHQVTNKMHHWVVTQQVTNWARRSSTRFLVCLRVTDFSQTRNFK